jgi:hypothetical protein
MRRDGVMLPFAAFDGNKWSMPWPSAVGVLDIPVTLDAVPEKWWGGRKPEAWALWSPGAAEPVPLAVAAPIVIQVGQTRRIGIRTGHQPTEAPAPFFELPYPKDGLAASGGATVEAIPPVSRHVPQWRELPETIKADIDKAEERTLAGLRNRAGWTHPVEREAREATPVHLEAWYSATLNQPGWSVSYIEAVRKYQPGPEDEGCGLETFVSGWVHHNSRTPKPKTDLVARVTYCDRDGIRYMLPLGLLRLRNRAHWVVQISSWQSEWYAVVEATPDRIRYVAEFLGGGRALP